MTLCGRWRGRLSGGLHLHRERKMRKNQQACKERLKKHCDELNDANLNAEEIHGKLKDLCDNKKSQEKCQNLKSKLQNECDTFKTPLSDAVKKGISKLEDSDCANEKKCVFLEGACLTLAEDCNKLRNLCYQKERNKVAEKALSRVLNGNFQTNVCKEKLKKACIELREESDELLKLCLYQDETCKKIEKEEKNNCQSLKTEIDGLKSKLKEKCPSLLERCHFYGENCKKSTKPDCEKLIKNCKAKNVTYIAPNLDFDPIKPETTLTEKIDLKNLYEKAAMKGIHIGKPPARDETALLALLIQDSTHSGNSKDKCEDVFKKNCKSFKDYKTLKGLCDGDKANENGTKICKELEKELSESAQIVSKKIKKHLLTSTPNNIIGWYELKTFLTERDCTRLLSDCFYFKGQ
ncbi:uncharacterized protein T551_00324, partial [Pneumocystis jirovecii RU7]